MDSLVLMKIRMIVLKVNNKILNHSLVQSKIQKIFIYRMLFLEMIMFLLFQQTEKYILGAKVNLVPLDYNQNKIKSSLQRFKLNKIKKYYKLRQDPDIRHFLQKMNKNYLCSDKHLMDSLVQVKTSKIEFLSLTKWIQVVKK